MSSLSLQQLIYTNFDQLGFQLITSPRISDTLKNIFMEKVVHQYWNAHNPPSQNFQLNYLYQVSQKNTLFGWMFMDDQDALGRQNSPYFICYYLTSPLDTPTLNKILTCLDRGPVQMLDRCFPLTSLGNIEIRNEDLDCYTPVRKGVAISPDARQQCLALLHQGKLLSLLCSTEAQVSIQPLIENAFFQASIPHNKPPGTNLPAKKTRSNFAIAHIQSLFSVVRLPSLFSSIAALHKKHLLLGGLIMAGGLSSLLLPQFLSKNPTTGSQNFEVKPERLASDSKDSGDVRPKSTHSPKTKSLPKTDGLSPLQERLHQNPLPDPALLSPFSDINLASDNEFPGLSNFPTNAPGSQPSPSRAPLSGSSGTSRSSSRSGTPPQTQLFSNFNVQGSSPTAAPPNTSIAPPAAPDPGVGTDSQPSAPIGGGDMPLDPPTPKAIAKTPAQPTSPPTPTQPLPSVALPLSQPELPPTAAPGVDE